MNSKVTGVVTGHSRTVRAMSSKPFRTTRRPTTDTTSCVANMGRSNSAGSRQLGTTRMRRAATP